MKKYYFPCCHADDPHGSRRPEFKEGVNYDVVKQTGSAQPEVLEFFSYYCPHCAKFEPIAEDLKKNLPEGVPMKKNPVAFLGREMGPEMQRAYAVASLLNVEGKLTPAIFDKIHTSVSTRRAVPT